ncbi:hypothetical protein CathTA2_2917 [Caldalkalibacillus thermarum TA2.A1]|uniref:XdhC Rossmann domain-containing protein n=1 Tax=Caldalkalibacillus thermarum (strain TA2.A1) TaxID=986075 RepID=F5LAI2_CALTT|nr:XdhC family protein [Caldalkalibacillus thermarum]EGL81731.1 hypothetical protein CathTA2_2917 [Caldalkalibacillus thermarum TA2.A1]
MITQDPDGGRGSADLYSVSVRLQWAQRISLPSVIWVIMVDVNANTYLGSRGCPGHVHWRRDLDPRKEFNGARRFPQAEHLVIEPDEADPAQLEGKWWLIMNHFQMRDEAALRLALQARPKFIGVLGPLSRTRDMLQNIGAEMNSGPIRAPIGLDVGAETIEEVAVSIVSELLAARSGRPGKPLHGKEKIHD